MRNFKRFAILLSVLLITQAFSVQIYALKDNKYVIDKNKDYYEYGEFWYNWCTDKEDRNKIILETSERPCMGTVLVPDTLNGKDVIKIKGSSVAVGFDINPENKYMECIDNVLFSKDKKKLMSYPRNDIRESYSIPNGTEVIGEDALIHSDNLKEVIIPGSVVNIELGAFFDCENLSAVTFGPSDSRLYVGKLAFDSISLTEVTFPSFNVQIDRSAFGFNSDNVKLLTYEQPEIKNEKNTIKWNEIPNALYYKVYMKNNSGEYKLINITNATSCKFSSLKQGKEYTLAVKPVAVILAENYDKKEDERYYPETFTIEGTMSEDVVVKG